MAKAKKIITWTVASMLVVFLILLGLIYILPGYDLYLVRSESMVPTIRMGDLIVTGPVGGFLNGTVEPGKIITYQHGTDLITHRVVSVDGSTVVMKGDALQHPDPWTVNLTDVTRVYLFKIPFIGFLLNFMRTKSGWFLAIIGPTAILVSLIIWEVLKETFKDDKRVVVKVNTARTEVSSPEISDSNKARSESNARLRRNLIEAMETQKTNQLAAEAEILKQKKESEQQLKTFMHSLESDTSRLKREIAEIDEKLALLATQTGAANS